jgi:hypothetical protein
MLTVELADRFPPNSKYTSHISDLQRHQLKTEIWPAPGSKDTELGVLMELEVGHGETEIHAGVQA